MNAGDKLEKRLFSLHEFLEKAAKEWVKKYVKRVDHNPTNVQLTLEPNEYLTFWAENEDIEYCLYNDCFLLNGWDYDIMRKLYEYAL